MTKELLNRLRMSIRRKLCLEYIDGEIKFIKILFFLFKRIKPQESTFYLIIK
jgi:hypothetical protein